MNGLLAIETATEACSIALLRDGRVQERHEEIPRQHSQRLFAMLRELLPTGGLREQGVEAIAYGCGPGSFTGLRVAASAVQGLAYASGLPAIAVSTLACQAQTALRMGLLRPGECVASLGDARLNEVYCALYTVNGESVVQSSGPQACAPEELACPERTPPTVLVGSGARYQERFPRQFTCAVRLVNADLLPHARDMLPLALAEAAAGRLQLPSEVAPVYVRDEISWKKIHEQGRRA